MSKFAATQDPNSETLSPACKITSRIIDAFSNANYVFLELYVKFSIGFSLEICSLGLALLSADSVFNNLLWNTGAYVLRDHRLSAMLLANSIADLTIELPRPLTTGG